MHFDIKGNAGSLISKSGSSTINVERLDDLICNENVDFIKMSIAGSELRALEGAVSVLKTAKPMIAINANYRLEDLINIPEFIKNFSKDYKIYLRKHSRFASSELVIYAIP